MKLRFYTEKKSNLKYFLCTHNLDTEKSKCVFQKDLMEEGFILLFSFQSDNSLSILDALSASGLRSLRYALEVPLAGRITANDISEDAYRSICSNISVNRVEDKVSPSLKDARYAPNGPSDRTSCITVVR